MAEESKQQNHYKLWVTATPLETPKIPISQLPKHDPARFEQYTEIIQETSKTIKNEQGEEEVIKEEKVKGFKLLTGETYEFDAQKGWTDEKGCYYNEDAEPKGWKVYDIVNGIAREHYYDKYGQYVPTDVEDDGDDEDDYDEDEQEHHHDESDDDSIEKEVKQYDLSGDL